MPGKHMTAELRQAIVDAYAEGLSIRQIAIETGRSYGGVNRTLVRAGVALRPRGVYRRPSKAAETAEAADRG